MWGAAPHKSLCQAVVLLAEGSDPVPPDPGGGSWFFSATLRLQGAVWWKAFGNIWM